MSKAIYSEIVELVLNIDAYKNRIDDAAKSLMALKNRVAESADWQLKLATTSYTKAIDDALKLEIRLTNEIQRGNQFVKERISLLKQRDNAARIELYGGKADLGSFLGKQARARDAMSGDDAIAATNIHNADELAKRKKQQAEDVADRERQARQRNHDAYIKDLREQEKLSTNNATAQAKLDYQLMERRQQLRSEENKRIRDSADFEARHQRRLMDAESKRRTDFDTFFDKQARGINLLATAERNAAIAQRADMHALLGMENARIAAVERRRAAEIAATKASMGYTVGSTILGGKTGAAFTAAASGSFLVGANNLGAMFYMMERMSYATGIGQRKLGEFVEKLGLVKLTGDGAEASIARFGTRVTQIGGGLVALAAPLGAMFAGNKLDNAVANMSTLLADATVKGDEFSRMMNTAANSASRLGESFGIGLVDTVNGFKTALSTGIDANQLEEFGTIAATVTKGLGTSFDDAVGILTTFRDSYNLSMTDMAEVSDVLFNAINVGKFQVDDLRNNIGRVVTASAEAGVSFKDMSAGLATLTRVGLSTSQSITSMNRFIQNIVSPTDKARAMFDKLGLATGHAAFKTHTLMEYLTKLKAAVGDNADLMGELFSTEQGRRGAIGLTTNLGLTADVRKAMDDVGTATVAANRAMDTFSQNFGKIFQTIWDVVQLVGRDLLQAANDVFFPGGPLSADSMVQFKNVLEAVGLVVKEVGVALITTLGAAFHAVKVLGSAFMGIANVLRGEVMAGMTMFSDAVTDGAKGMWAAFTNVFTQIGISADRVGENLKGMVKSDEVVNKLDKIKEAAKSVFGDDVVAAMSKFGNKAASAYDTVYESIRKARYEAAKFAWEQANPQSTVTVAKERFKPSDAMLDTLEKIRRGHDVMQRGYHPKAVYEANKAGGFIDPNSERAKEFWETYTVAQEAFAAKAAERAAKAALEAWTKARDNALRGDFPEFVPKAGGTQAKAIDPNNVNGNAILKNLEEALTAVKAVTEKASLKVQVGTYIDNKGDQQKAYEDITDRVKKLEIAKRELLDVEQALAKAIADGAVTPEQIEATSAAVKQMASDIMKEDAEIQKEKIANYKQQQKYELDLYNAKMGYLEKERNKLRELREDNKSDIEKVKEKLQDIRSKERPGAARREFKDAAEADIAKARQTTDPYAIDKLLDNATKLIEKMVATGDAPERAGIDQKTLLGEIEKIREDNDRKIEARENSIKQQAAQATKTYTTNTEDNPVAQAAIKEAQRILNDMAKEAAKRGITMTGNLVSSVDIQVSPNIPVSEFRTAVVDLVKSEVKRIYEDSLKGNERDNDTGGNSTPVGAP